MFLSKEAQTKISCLHGFSGYSTVGWMWAFKTFERPSFTEIGTTLNL
jgi:hypothetical protein